MPTIDELMARIDSLEGRLNAPPPLTISLPSEDKPAPVGPDGKAIEPDAPAEQPGYTWDQLQTAVQENKISEAAAQQIWADQNHRKAVKEATDTVVTTLTERQSASKVDAEIARYKELIPALADKSSEQFQRVAREFNRQVQDLGHSKKELKTELVALQAAFGPIDALAKAVKKPKNEGHRDVSHDDPGSAADDTKDMDPENTPPSSLGASERRYYENAINTRVYKNWGEVREELKHATPRLRRRYGAKV